VPVSLYFSLLKGRTPLIAAVIKDRPSAFIDENPEGWCWGAATKGAQEEGDGPSARRQFRRLIETAPTAKSKRSRQPRREVDDSHARTTKRTQFWSGQ